MAFKFPDPIYPQAPKGKRSVRKNIYGNTVGYVSGRRFWEFGAGISAEHDAQYWLNGASLEEIGSGEALANDPTQQSSRHHY